MKLFCYVLIMALITYLIRMLPIAVFQKKIRSVFWQSFLYYIPYAVLSAMTIPAIFYSTGDVFSAAVGAAAAAFLAFKGKSLIVVAAAACAAAYLAGVIGGIIG